MLHNWHLRVEIDAPTLNAIGDVLKVLDYPYLSLEQYLYHSELGANQKLALTIFKASNFWLEGFRARLGTSSVRRCGEHSSVDHYRDCGHPI